MGRGAALVAAVLAMTAPAQAQTAFRVLDFAELDGWEDGDQETALNVFRSTCGDLNDPEWQAVCAVAEDQTDARSFFEIFFRPVLMQDGADPLFTGYFEPEIAGALERTDTFRYPIYSLPPEIVPGEPWLSRAEIEETDALKGRGLEIAWLSDPVEAFFLHVQGSGRIRLPDGSVLRVGYGGKNGHEYRSVGEELVRRGVYQPHQVSAQVIRSWVMRNPGEGADLLRINPSYVFFRRLDRLPPDQGPLGAMNRPLTPMVSVAVDPSRVPLGAPVWIEKDGADPLRRLMVAQDTGSAIKGAQRADIFFGTGKSAGWAAGRVRDAGRMVVLLPIQKAYALLPGF